MNAKVGKRDRHSVSRFFCDYSMYSPFTWLSHRAFTGWMVHAQPRKPFQLARPPNYALIGQYVLAGALVAHATQEAFFDL